MTTKSWEPWNPKSKFLELVHLEGGLANHHAHFDKTGLITPENLNLSDVDMQVKWELVRSFKKASTSDDYLNRISWCVEQMIEQQVTYCRSMIDVDSSSGLRAIEAAMEIKKFYAEKIRLEFSAQPHEGLIDKATGLLNRELFELYAKGCEIADWCGALPSRDRPYPNRHLDAVMTLAKKLGKPVEVHIDQENNPREYETEMLACKTIEHDMQGQVYGVHAVSLAAKTEAEQDRIIGKILEADMGIVVCPSAALSMRQLSITAPSHNSIAPLPKLLRAGVRCYMGTDNIHDLHMPMVDGDIWTECRIAMEACRFYDIDLSAKWACNKLSSTFCRPQPHTQLNNRTYSP
jgi:cytosine/adenosine deaminase-related metal-dependent hydrolase